MIRGFLLGLALGAALARAAGELACCRLCFEMLYLPRAVAEPLLRWERRRRPHWWRDRRRLYPLLWSARET